MDPDASTHANPKYPSTLNQTKPASGSSRQQQQAGRKGWLLPLLSLLLPARRRTT
jgi:hypothetical protein